MKNIKKISATLLAILIVVLSLPVATASAATDADLLYGRKLLGQMSDGADMVKVYDYMVEEIPKLTAPIYMPQNVTVNYDAMVTIYNMVYSDHPEFFWIAKGTPSVWGIDVVSAVSPIYVTDDTGYGKFSNLNTAKTQYNNKVAELTSGLNGKSNYEKAKILHDRLCKTTVYTMDCNNHQNAYGALVEGKAVCNGYARAYHQLLKEVGIPAWYVAGTSRGIGHAWNLVKIDGDWYYSDATWDDTNDSFEYFDNSYEYMNITTAQLLTDHTIDSAYASLVPNVTATAANYYVKENLIFSTFNKDQLLNAFLRSEDYAIFAKFSGGYDYSNFLYSFYAVEKDIATSLGSSDDYELHEHIFSYTVDHNTDNANWIVYLDYDITTSCNHTYSNACDTSCNSCGKIRIVGDHVYTNACDTDCNECGATRETTHSYSNNCDTSCNVCGNIRVVPDHIYDNNCDKNCNECGAIREVADHVYDNECDTSCNECNKSRTAPHVYDDDQDEYCNKCNAKRVTDWKIDVDTTGIYNITPNKTLNGFTKDSITVSDKNGNAVKYNDQKQGYPLVSGQEYTVVLNIDYTDTNNLSWKLTKKADTIFPDTSSSGWYNDAVTYAVGAGIMSGYKNGKFGTSDSIQRQDFLVMLARLDGVDLNVYGAKKSAFPDVPEGSYFEAAVNWGSEKGLVTGYQNGKFGVGDKVTREQLVTFLYRYAKYKGYDFSHTDDRQTIVSAQYNDFKKVSGFATDPILWAIEKGVISGKTNTTIVPQGNAQRCEVAKIMYNIFLNDIFK